MKNIVCPSKGFTLIELAIVLVIISVLVGSFIGTLAKRIDNTRISDTKDELEEIKQALIGYAYRNGSLPCPDCIGVLCNPGSFRDGIEDRGTNGADAGQCSVGNQTGFLPWVTLGLARGDVWNTRYRDWVDVTDADNGAGLGSAFVMTSPNGAGVIQEPDYVADATGATLGPLANNVVAVVFSHGKNTFGGRSTDDVIQPAIPAADIDEADNVNNDSNFVDRPPTTSDATTAGGEFDDILIWITEFELKAKMVEAGVLP